MSGAHPSAEVLAASVVAGDRRALGRLITRIESADESVLPVLRILYQSGNRAPVLGITGPPGAGKSTLVDHLIEHFRAAGERLAVLAVDPSSPFTGGAILGDRIRMSRHNADPNVFIRSMAARGYLGGLAGAVGDTLILFDAMGADRVIVETVGVGQNEMDIMMHADTVLVVQTPAGGDAVQAVKAGLLEVGDIYVVNKMDNDGADRMVAALRESIEFRHGHSGVEVWRPAVCKTQAVQGAGIGEVSEAVRAQLQHFAAFAPQRESRKHAQVRALLLARIADTLRFRFARQNQLGPEFEHWLNEVIARRCTPNDAAANILAVVNAQHRE